MRTHPVFLRLEKRPCVVVGGDAAAEAKVRACLDAGAVVTVIASEVTPGLAGLARDGALRHVARGWRAGDLRGAALVYASTGDPELIARLAAEAERERVPLNVIDVPDACTFLSPAVVQRGDLQIAVGTGGASPGLAARLRRELEARVGPEYAAFTAILGAVRRALADDPGRREALAALLDSPLLELVRRGERSEIDRLLVQVTGGRLSLDGLGLEERS